MVPPETLRSYRAFLEYRLLTALEGRAIAYWADATGVLTRALLDLGRHLGYVVSLEKRYGEGGSEGRHLRSDVHWQGPEAHLWEIDRTVKNASAAKLAAAGEGEKYWVLWAQDNELLSLRLLELQGVNLIILGHDVRKRVWERLVFEREERSALQAILARGGRFASAIGWEAALGAKGQEEDPDR
jgi:hypothetical protein